MLICGVQPELSYLSFLLYQSYMWKNSPDINNNITFTSHCWVNVKGLVGV